MSEETAWPPDPDRDVVLDARRLRALAHPTRIKIVGLLRIHGPATATTLAQRLGVNTGATSYHLRELAKAGMVEEDESRGNARDRWWRSVYASTFLDDTEILAKEPDAALSYLRGVAQVNAEEMFRHVEDLPGLPQEWQAASTISDYGLHLTAEQLTGLLEELVAVLAKYRTDPDAEPPAGTRKVAIQVQAFPREEDR
jgi:DNA-binding transcriptional ArsR family regulator